MNLIEVTLQIMDFVCTTDRKREFQKHLINHYYLINYVGDVNAAFSNPDENSLLNIDETW